MKRFLYMAMIVLWGIASPFTYVLGADPIARIRDISGTVELKKPGASSWTSARVGDTLVRDTVISTGFKSTAIVTLGNSTITVKPLTRLSLAELTTVDGTEQAALNLRTGRVRADVEPPTGGNIDFSVHSPSATASVRGTTFELDVRNISVSEGTVQFGPTSGSGRAREIPVLAGESSFVDTRTGMVVSPAMVRAASLTPPVPAGRDTPVKPGASRGVGASGGAGASGEVGNPPGSLIINVELTQGGN